MGNLNEIDCQGVKHVNLEVLTKLYCITYLSKTILQSTTSQLLPLCQNKILSSGMRNLHRYLSFPFLCLNAAHRERAGYMLLSSIVCKCAHLTIRYISYNQTVMGVV